ncbi:hypothetical protein JKP88DRAFT_288431 [Tribonema minus]|uniref:Uncharacterized protein n=1 Tax=Tribonema minus TaxID=303371 RepID=A0A836CIY6_9STRA|nr:hypothetical protein JKP88DRAFT_288431 [Tribonema minus]
MASLSLLPKCAWGLNKELQRDAKPAVSVTATEDMPLWHLQLQHWNPDWAIAPLPHALVHLSIAYETIRHHHHGLLTPTLAPLPHTLETLTVSTSGAETVHPILGRLPPRLSELNLQGAVTYDGALGPLPPSLTSLRLGRSFTQALGQLPDSLTELHVAHPYRHPSGDNFARSRFDRPLGRLPAAMQVLNLQYSVNFNHPLGCLPATLRELRLSRAYDHPLRTLPPALEVLVLGNEFQQELQLELPSTLRVFRMGERFNAPVVLPDALLELYIGGSYTHPLHLRPSLRLLHVGASYRHPIPPLPLTRKSW